MKTNQQRSKFFGGGWGALALVCSLPLLPAAGHLSAADHNCAVVTAGAGAVRADGTLMNAGQNAIGRAVDRSGSVKLYAGVMYCLRNSGVASILGDCRNDNDIDLSDYQWFRKCMTGPGGTVSSKCECADMDGDGDVDETDASLFQAGFTGHTGP